MRRSAALMAIGALALAVDGGAAVGAGAQVIGEPPGSYIAPPASSPIVTPLAPPILTPVPAPLPAPAPASPYRGAPGGFGPPRLAPRPGREFEPARSVRVYFHLNSAAIDAGAAAILDEQAALFTSHRGLRVRVEGNADEPGSRDYDHTLGLQRANAVRDYLAAHGVDPARIETSTWGADSLVDTGHTRAAHARNRNVCITLIGGER